MKRLTTAPNLALATLWADMLGHAGVVATVQRQYASSVAGEVPPDQTQPEIWIQDAAQFDRATRLLHEAQGVGILHLRPDHWELIDLRPPTETRDILLGLARVANFYHANPTIDPFVASRTRGEA